MKVSIIYHSESGNTEKTAKQIMLGTSEVEGVTTKMMSIDQIDRDFVRESAAVLFGSPTYCGSFSWQIKRWFDTTDVDLEGKLGSVFATANYIGGGAEVAELSMVGHMLVRGMLIYSAGFTRGNPFTHFGAVAIKDGDDQQKERARIFGKRVAEKAMTLFGNMETL